MIIIRVLNVTTTTATTDVIIVESAKENNNGNDNKKKVIDVLKGEEDGNRERARAQAMTGDLLLTSR